MIETKVVRNDICTYVVSLQPFTEQHKQAYIKQVRGCTTISIFTGGTNLCVFLYRALLLSVEGRGRARGVSLWKTLRNPLNFVESRHTNSKKATLNS